ncbi:MAG: tolB protein precursor [bacterium]|nr:tolB protein precursor [bacterium]
MRSSLVLAAGLVGAGLVAAVAGCGPDTRTGNHPDGGGGSGGGALTSIDITPATASVVVNGGSATAAQKFVATGHFTDGHTADVSSTIGWSISDPGLGSVTSGAFAGVARRGGTAVVHAGDASVQGAATLTVKYVDTRVSTDDGSTAPAGSPGLFNGTDDPTLAPPLAYPLDGAHVPHNLGLLEVQWKKAAGAADLFEVAFTSPTIDYRVYTNASQPAGGRLSITPAEWSAIADANIGQTVAVNVRGVASGQPGKVGSSAAAMLSLGSDVSGGLYYFAPVSATGQQIGAVVRHSFGDTSGAATQFYAPANGTRCVGCHVITRDGTKMAVTYDGGNGGAAIVTVPSLGMLLAETSGDKWNFASYSPDGNRMVASSQGTLKIIDTSGGATNGAVLQTLADASTGHYASHPDWSADGSKIVYVDVGVPNGNSEWQFSQGSLVVVSDLGMGMFGNPQKIVKSTGPGENNYYPSFSPDGKWVLFNRSSAAAYSEKTAQAWVVSVDGAIGPIALGNANSTTPNPTNSWPRWNPFIVHEPTGDLMYLTFSSTRDYGIELVGANQPQIWMAAFDPAKAAASTDPSSVAFWMPFQDVKSHNHIAQWTATFIP